MKKPILLSLIFLFSIQSVYAMQITDNLYFTIEPNTIKCIDLILPDHIGNIIPGVYDYYITMTPLPERTWSDLSEQTLTTDENNTAIIPICFSSFNKPYNNCSDPFTLTVNLYELNITRTFHGGVCISDHPDVDTTNSDSNDNMETINDNADIFDLSLTNQHQFATPNENKTFTLFATSYADTTLDISVQTDASISPRNAQLTLNNETPSKKVNFIASASETGDYDIVFTARINGCNANTCTKTKTATLKVTDTEIEETGFTVNLIPENINVKRLAAVEYKLIINNKGEKADFSLKLIKPSGITTTFSDEIIEIDSGEETITFFVTPMTASSLFEIEAQVKSGNTTRTATSYLSTDELLTDTERDIDALDEDSDIYEDWRNTYNSRDYGDELDTYESLRERLNNERNEDIPTTPPNNTPNNYYEPETEQQDFTIYIIIAVVIVAVIVLAVAFNKFSKKEVRTEEL